jgi:hypothetical protein
MRSVAEYLIHARGLRMVRIMMLCMNMPLRRGMAPEALMSGTYEVRLDLMDGQRSLIAKEEIKSELHGTKRTRYTYALGPQLQTHPKLTKNGLAVRLQWLTWPWLIACLPLLVALWLYQ